MKKPTARFPIYLDYNATTPVDEDVMEAMLPYFTERFGNPGSAHAKGREAAKALADARRHIARFAGCAAEDVYFTASATEANNLVIEGVAAANAGRGRHLIISSIEHPSVRAPAMRLRDRGFEVTELPVDGYGLVDPSDLKKSIRRGTVLVSIMHANNETGTVEPIAELAAVCRERGVLFHTDCCQSAGKIPVSISRWGADFASFAGHKMYAPKGVGVLIRRSGAPVEPMILGGGQEDGLRAGTENVAFAAGLGKAMQIARATLKKESLRQRSLRDALEDLLVDAGGVVNGHPLLRLPNTLSISFPGLTGRDILDMAKNVQAGIGAACHNKPASISRVLAAMGIEAPRALGTIRLSPGRPTTKADVESAGDAIAHAVKKLRAGK
jgi:cysteine desulfurase